MPGVPNGEDVNGPVRLARGMDDVSSTDDVFNASSIAEIKAALSHLHEQDLSVTARLDALVASQKTFSRELTRLDLLRAHLTSQAGSTRAISQGMLSEAAATASRISTAVRKLDLEQSKVRATLEVVEQVTELKACVLGVTGSMGAPQDWETAASYVSRASRIPDEVVRSAFASEMVPTAEVPDPPSVTLDNAAESLCSLFLREFDKAVKENDGAKITRFFKLFPLIGRSEVGLDVYGRYVCQGVAARARANLNTGTMGAQGKEDEFFYANALTKLFEHIAQIVDSHGVLVERHYGAGKMNKVIERLQVEADVQGGILLDTWSDERRVDRKLMEVKSYAFTFLVQSFLPAQRSGGTPRTSSPAAREGGVAASDEDGVDMKEIDRILNEIAVMLSRWSLYSRFLAEKHKVGALPGGVPKSKRGMGRGEWTANANTHTQLPASDDKEDGSGDETVKALLGLPKFVQESSLAKKVHDRLVLPFNLMTTFFVRRSVEKAFQLDEQPAGLTLNPHKPLQSEPPHISSAVDDIMYIVNKVLQQALATSQLAVVTNVVPTLSRVLGSDFIGMTQRKMRDECYPKAPVQGTQPPEATLVSFLVLINNLDVGVDYIRRIVQNNTERKEEHLPTVSAGDGHGDGEAEDAVHDLFPMEIEAATVRQTMQSLVSSFESKANDLLSDGTQVVFNNVVKHRLRPILADAFRDIDYQRAHKVRRHHGGGGSGKTKTKTKTKNRNKRAAGMTSAPARSRSASLSSSSSTSSAAGAGSPSSSASSSMSPSLPSSRAGSPSSHPKQDLVRSRFAAAWTELLTPLARILTASAFDRLLGLTLGYLARLLEKRLWAYHGRVGILGATRLERDIAGLVSAAVDVGGAGSGGGGGGGGGGVGGGVTGPAARYRHRESFARCLQIVLVLGMDDDEWEEVSRQPEADLGVVLDRLSVDERVRARSMLISGQR